MSYEKIAFELNKAKVFSKLSDIKIRGKTLTLTVSSPKKHFEWIGLMLGYNWKIEEDREEYFLKPDGFRDTGKRIEIDCTIDLEEFPFRMTHWSFYAVYMCDGIYYYSKVLLGSKKKESRLQFLLSKDYYKTGDGHIVFVYIGSGKQVMLRFRESASYDNRLFRARELLAKFIVHSFGKRMKKKKIWLIYEKRCAKAQDNGYYLFKYCMENDMELYLDRKIFFVIDKNSADRKKLDAYSGHVLNFLSLKHLIYLIMCDLLVSPDSRQHAYLWQCQKSAIDYLVRKKKHVFLGHGVLAMKRLNDSFLARNMRSVLCTATSDLEAGIIKNELGFPGYAVPVTGYARFDALYDTSGDSREILLMPTHRSWLFGVERDIFTASDYYHRYMAILNSDELISYLEQKDVYLNFYLHPSIGEHVSAFSGKSDRVRIIRFGEVSLDDLMMRCKLLVTDYSSVAWDVFYMGKPIILYQYDMEKYQETWGSYIDLEKDSPGERAQTHKELITLIKSYVDNGFEMKTEILDKREKTFTYIDHDNSRRICEALRSRAL